MKSKKKKFKINIRNKNRDVSDLRKLINENDINKEKRRKNYDKNNIMNLIGQKKINNIKKMKKSKIRNFQINLFYPSNICKINFPCWIICILLLFLFIYNKYFQTISLDKEKEKKIHSDKIFKKSNFSDYNDKKFALVRRLNCNSCGIFSNFIVFLGCMNKYFIEGYIPIIDMKTYPNMYNDYKVGDNNPWELFFEQPFGYTLEEVEKNAKIKEYKPCTSFEPRPNEIDMYYNEVLLGFWHDFANRFMPIKNEIMKEADKIRKTLFKKSKNILGIKMRGTDYITIKAKGHAIPPNLNTTINDVKNLDMKNNYDWIFISTEDDIIRERYIKEFEKKIKHLSPKEKVNYDFNKKSVFGNNNGVKGNIEYAKNYVLNIIILSKCLDIVIARCSGAAGAFILTEGFRNVLIYNSGENK